MFNITLPTTAIGSFQPTDPGFYMFFTYRSTEPGGFFCEYPTGGTVTLTQNDAVAGGRLVGIFDNVTFPLTFSCPSGATISGSFSVNIHYVDGN